MNYYIDNLNDPHQLTNIYDPDSPVVQELHKRLVDKLEEERDPCDWI